MKLLFYINAIHEGGAERVMINLTEQFALDGNDVTLVTSFVDSWEYPVSERVKRLSLEPEKGSYSFLHKNVIWTKKLREIIKKTNPDAAISFMAEPNFRLLIAGAGLRTKCLISVRNDPEKEYPNALYKFLAKTLYRRADGVVFQTTSAKDWFPESISKKSRIIFNQVSGLFYDRPSPLERHGIVTTGRLTSQKNHSMLIDAFEKIKSKVDDNLYIYGEGEMRDELESKIEFLNLCDRVFLPGNLGDVAPVIEKAKVFVLSSDFEGMPNSLMEAMALGVPSISTDCPCYGPRMLSEDGKDVVLTPVNDAESLGRAIEEVIADSEKANRLSQNARKRSEDFRPKRIYGEWKKYISEVAKMK